MGLLRSIAAAFSFLTRLPMPGPVASDVELGRSVVWFPLVGAAIGGALVGVERLLREHLPAGLVAVALVGVAAALTGGLHLDGVADTFDAWGGGRGERARMLEIMRDSRIGAHGALALILLVAAKIFAIADLVSRGDVWPLFAAPVLARWAVVPLIAFFRYARLAGLGSSFRAHTRAAHFAGATLVALALTFAGGAALGLSPSAWTAAASALGVALALGVMLDRRLGGLTGDVYGAAIELAELAVLVSATVTTASR